MIVRWDFQEWSSQYKTIRGDDFQFSPHDDKYVTHSVCLSNFACLWHTNGCASKYIAFILLRNPHWKPVEFHTFYADYIIIQSWLLKQIPRIFFFHLFTAFSSNELVEGYSNSQLTKDWVSELKYPFIFFLFKMYQWFFLYRGKPFDGVLIL